MLSDPSDSRTGSALAHAFANYYTLRPNSLQQGCVKFEGDVGSRQELGSKPALGTENCHRLSQLDVEPSPRLPPFSLLLPLLLAAAGLCCRRWLLLLLLLLAAVAVVQSLRHLYKENRARKHRTHVDQHGNWHGIGVASGCSERRKATYLVVSGGWSCVHAYWRGICQKWGGHTRRNTHMWSKHANRMKTACNGAHGGKRSECHFVNVP